MGVLKIVGMACALVIACGRIEAQASGAKASGHLENGKRMFADVGCATCHGTEGQGTDLAPQIAPPPLTLEATISYVRQPTGKMPPVPVGTASDQQLADIYAYLKSVGPQGSLADQLKGNPDKGKKLFVAYGCYECHGWQGAGAAIAPRIGPPALSLAGMLRYVRAPTGQMPPYTAKVASDQDLADIYAYLKTFPPPQPASKIPLLNQ
jgi:mono/diheme cytochrome c family protein